MTTCYRELLGYFQTNKQKMPPKTSPPPPTSKPMDFSFNKTKKRLRWSSRNKMFEVVRGKENCSLKMTNKRWKKRKIFEVLKERWKLSHSFCLFPYLPLFHAVSVSRSCSVIPLPFSRYPFVTCWLKSKGSIYLKEPWWFVFVLIR